ncbi:uncharacterized protein LOC119462856 [Dermacentor silvarum]|uniref:uncharacterized protein LOC119462856 n=1 Tax=Dermacentor silvarum TaxID=543639 RepID=UPI0021011BEC|nr:uncharacterized protein LOC119462856 [Dermacentor silvarum]
MNLVEKKLLAIFLVFVAPATRASCEYVDIFEVIGGLPHVRAIYTFPAEEAGDQMCMRANLTTFNPYAGKASYFWSWIDDTGNNKSLTIDISKGDSPDVVNDILSSDPEHPVLATIPFAVEKICFVLKTADLQGQCILWVDEAIKDNYPEKCAQGYKAACPEGVLLSQEGCV